MAEEAIGGLAGVLIWTEPAHFEAMARFYRDTLGLAPRSSRSDFNNVDCIGVRLSISVADLLHGPPRRRLRVMINLAVADIRAGRARLAAAGVAFPRHPEREDGGGCVAGFADP